MFLIGFTKGEQQSIMPCFINTVQHGVSLRVDGYQLLWAHPLAATETGIRALHKNA